MMALVLSKNPVRTGRYCSVLGMAAWIEVQGEEPVLLRARHWYSEQGRRKRGYLTSYTMVSTLLHWPRSTEAQRRMKHGLVCSKRPRVPTTCQVPAV